MTTFFRSLKRNNRREWFQPRKHVFEQHVKEPMIELVTALNSEFAKIRTPVRQRSQKSDLPNLSGYSLQL